jgi:7-cyano-7-deazaguanine synthase in queuosine biosynthesis
MYHVHIEEIDFKNNLMVLELNIDDRGISRLIFNPFDCFESFINRPSEGSLDILYFTSIVYMLDKMIDRRDTYECWSRDISVTIPVSDVDKWNNSKNVLKEAIDFLTSDNWIFEFEYRKSSFFHSDNQETLNTNNFDSICLFSGGLDSLAGAINLIDDSDNVLLVSHIDGHGANNPLQEGLITDIKQIYNNKNIRHSVFHVYSEDKLTELKHENTTRGRSILFHGLALFHAINLDVDQIIAPENGVISINLPLTPSRTCSNSTKTMHPYFLKKLQEALHILDIDIKIINPYILKTKAEMLVENKNQSLISNLATKTLSCSKGGSHNANWSRGNAVNCGYCIPCTIRRASIHKFDSSLDRCIDYGNSLNNREINFHSSSDEGLDLLALSYFLNQDISEKMIKREIMLMAPVDDIDSITNMLIRGYAEIKEYICDKGDDYIKGLFHCNQT